MSIAIKMHLILELLGATLPEGLKTIFFPCHKDATLCLLPAVRKDLLIFSPSSSHSGLCKLFIMSLISSQETNTLISVCFPRKTASVIFFILKESLLFRFPAQHPSITSCWSRIKNSILKVATNVEQNWSMSIFPVASFTADDLSES